MRIKFYIYFYFSVSLPPLLCGTMFVMFLLIEKSNMITIAEKQANKSDREKEKNSERMREMKCENCVTLIPIVGL